MLKKIFLCLAVSAAIYSVPALAQNVAPTVAPPTCPANTNTMVWRISTITGTRAGYDQAVKDHIRWYREHGYTNNTITNGDVLVTQQGSDAWKKPEAPQVISLHSNPPMIPADKQDAAWKAYVAEYNANSKILSSVYSCFPK